MFLILIYNASHQEYRLNEMVRLFFCVTRVRNAFTHDKKEPLFEAKNNMSYVWSCNLDGFARTFSPWNVCEDSLLISHYLSTCCQLSHNPTETGELQPIRNENVRFWLVAAHWSGLGCGWANKSNPSLIVCLYLTASCLCYPVLNDCRSLTFLLLPRTYVRKELKISCTLSIASNFR